MAQKYSFLNGEIVPHEKAFVHIEDRGYQFSDGVYEVILIVNKKLIDLEGHFDRLLRSLKKLSINHDIKKAFLVENIHQLIEKNAIINGSVYLQITRGVYKRSQIYPSDLSPSVVMKMSPVEINRTLGEGLSIMSHEDIRWQYCDIKSISLLASSLLKKKAYDQGFEDVVYIKNSFITEASFANIFIVDEDNTLITTPADESILEGITRNRIIELAAANGIKIEYRKFSLEEVLSAKEVFLTSSTLLVRPVTSVDDKLIGKGEIGQLTEKLASLYYDFIGV